MGILPDGPTAPSNKMSDYVWLLYGAPGVGKTTLASQFPSPLFLATEAGTAGMEAAKVDIATWKDFDVYLKAIQSEKHKYKTIVLDTADVAHVLCSSYVCDQNGWVDVADGDWGRGWRAVSREFTNLIAKLRALPMCVVFIIHEKREEIREKVGSKDIATGRFYVSSALPGKAREMLHGAVDFILRCEITPENQRILRTQPIENERERIEAKARGQLGVRELAETIDMSFESLSKEFRASFK